MPLKKYGVLKGGPIGHLRDADDDHYQILLQAGSALHRIAVNVESASKEAPSTVLFQTTSSLPKTLKDQLRTLGEGYKKLASSPNGLAQDYVRGGIVTPSRMKPVPPNVEGDDNDLKDALESAILKAIAAPGSMVYAFGEKWGPEKNKRDQYFRFLPGNGIHDIHMNQGNSGKWRRDNGIYQDGAIYVEYPNDKWTAFFFAFQSQTFSTNDEGMPIEEAKKKPAKKKPGRKKQKKRSGKKRRRRHK